MGSYSEGEHLPKTSNTFKILLDTLRETRTIRIKGKNVDDLDLEKLASLIQQANKKSSKSDFTGLLKSLRKQFPSKKEPAIPNQKTAPDEQP